MDINYLDNLRYLLCSFNLGAICFVQWVHYPLFSEVGSPNFQRYHKRHVTRTSLLLGTTLSIEMLVNLGMLFLNPFSWRGNLPLFFLIIGWGVTFLVSVPQHRQLEAGFSEKAHKTLLLSNLIRVLCWGGALFSMSRF